ncbi:MAG: hypothetical protein GY858_08390 [Candidatus Omnitrophica bacterium]|nr:hypothetical protein [Candidatus Omnitrophota bacterium]
MEKKLDRKVILGVIIIILIIFALSRSNPPKKTLKVPTSRQIKATPSLDTAPIAFPEITGKTIKNLDKATEKEIRKNVPKKRQNDEFELAPTAEELIEMKREKRKVY